METKGKSSDFYAALLVAVPALGFVVAATWRASWAALGRDQGIFQYVAWAVAKGDVLYRDVRDVNGPVVALVHRVFQMLGGENEHRFRTLDLLFTGLSFAGYGAALGKTWRARIAWAVAGWCALSAQYLAYGFWDTAQRESFLDWFVLSAVALQIAPALSDLRARTTRLALVLCGFASVLPVFGKPTYALFPAIQVLVFAIEPEPFGVRVRRLGFFAAGGVLAVLVPLLVVGDRDAWMRITFVDVPAMYRFIWPRTPRAILGFPYYGSMAGFAGLTSVAVVALVAWKKLPRRMLAVALFPLAGLVSALVQAKGFPYHFHPVTLGTGAGWLAILATLRHRIVLVFSLAVGVRAGVHARNAPYPAVPADPESAEGLAPYIRVDFFPKALRDGAAYVASRTGPDDRIQTYAMDAYFLFLARRLSATPYIYAYDLNVDAALYGSFDADGPKPTERERDVIRALRDRHEKDMLERLERDPPKAFVFIDNSPLMTSADAVTDFSTHCPTAAVWLVEHYQQTADFDGVRIWLRRDLAAREVE